MDRSPRRIAVIAPMPNELRPVAKMLGLRKTSEQGGMPVYSGRAGDCEVIATGTGIGPERAEAAAERLLSSTTVDRVVVSGIAGGIPGASNVGDLIVPEEVYDATSGDRYRATPPGDLALTGVIRTGDATDYELDSSVIAGLRDDGVTALDMETAAIARACERHGVPWVAFRAISDMAGDESVGPEVMTLVHPDGSPDVWAGLRFLVTHPGRIPRMVRLGRDAQRAATHAARAAVGAIEAGNVHGRA